MAQDTSANNSPFDGFVNLQIHVASIGFNIVPSSISTELSNLLNAVHVKMVTPTVFENNISCNRNLTMVNIVAV